jgi:hypothetical protein
MLKCSVQQVRELEKAAKELAGKQAQFNAQEQAGKEATARAGSELRERQRHAAQQKDKEDSSLWDLGLPDFPFVHPISPSFTIIYI